MTAPAWWLEYRVPNFGRDWIRITRPAGTLEAAEDWQREMRRGGFEARIEEAA